MTHVLLSLPLIRSLILFHFPLQVFIEFAKHQYDDAPGDSGNLSRTLSRQLSGQCAGEGHHHEADTRL